MSDKTTKPANFLSSPLEMLLLLCEQQRASNQPACSFHTTVQVSWLLKQGQAPKPEVISIKPISRFSREQNAATQNNTLVSLVVK